MGGNNSHEVVIVEVDSQVHGGPFSFRERLMRFITKSRGFLLSKKLRNDLVAQHPPRESDVCGSISVMLTAWASKCLSVWVHCSHFLTHALVALSLASGSLFGLAPKFFSTQAQRTLITPLLYPDRGHFPRQGCYVALRVFFCVCLATAT